MRHFYLIFGAGLFLALALTAPALAQSHPAHEHGAAKLNIIVEDKEVELSLDSPLINFIPFERAPNNPEEEAQARDLGTKLAEPASLFIFTKEAGCQPKAFDLISDPLSSLLPESNWPQDPDEDEEIGDLAEDGDSEEADHDSEEADAKPEAADHDHEKADAKPEAADHDHEDADHDHEEGEHGDIEASYLFECAKPEALKGVDVRLFEKYPTLTRLDVQISLEAGQKAATLDPKNTQAQW
ncbi:MAG: DUF2796 domain-containing protein [Deltaproteobacteria bacterium]|jgi:hypothetical protein|nr:DUF2796 domain-containing protein [Deltaproteobacteria bacterium]